jgi:hypothetical protein
MYAFVLCAYIMVTRLSVLVQCFRDFQSGISKATQHQIALERGIFRQIDKYLAAP